MSSFLVPLNSLEHQPLIAFNGLTRTIDRIASQLPDRESAPIGLTRTISSLVITIIGALGLPFQNKTDPTIKVYLIGNTLAKAWAGIHYVNNHLQDVQRSTEPCSSKRLFSKVFCITAEALVATLSHWFDLIGTGFSEEGAASLSLEIIGDIFLRMYSIQLSIYAVPMIRYACSSSLEAKSFHLQQSFLKGLSRMRDEYIQMSSLEKDDFIMSLNETRALDTAQRMPLYMNHMYREKPPACSSKISRFFQKVKPSLFTAAAAWPLGAYMVDTWHSAKSAGMPDVVAGSFAALAIYGFQMSAKCLSRTLEIYFSGKWSLASQIKKGHAFLLKAFVTTFGLVGSYGFFSTGTCEKETISLPLCIPYAVYLFSLFTTVAYDIIDHGIEQSILAEGLEGERRQVQIKREFDQLICAIKNSSCNDFLRIFLKFPDELKLPLLEEFTQEEKDMLLLSSQ